MIPRTFYGPAYLAHTLGISPQRVTALVKSGRITPDSWEWHPSRNPTPLFTERTAERIKEEREAHK